MRVRFPAVACLVALFAAGVGFFEKAAIAQNGATGLWIITLDSDAACPLFAVEILANGDGAAWTNSADPDPDLPDLEGKVKVSGNQVEAAMTAYGDAGNLRMSLRGTVSPGRLNAQVTVTDGTDTVSGACAFDDK
ncbi:MAG: hypothetical protein WD073_07635 [Xanthobacteraceae bacterium]